MALAGMQAGRVAPPLGSPGCDAAAALRPLLPPRLRGTSSAVGQRGRAGGPLPWLTTSPTPGLRL